MRLFLEYGLPFWLVIGYIHYVHVWSQPMRWYSYVLMLPWIIIGNIIDLVSHVPGSSK